MLMPSIFRENMFDDWFDFPDFSDLDKTERKLYGRHADRLMKTDVHEHEDHYEVDIDLPGFKKDEITIELNNGYLTVSAAKGLDKDQNDKKGKVIRQERYAGGNAEKLLCRRRTDRRRCESIVQAWRFEPVPSEEGSKGSAGKEDNND